MKNIATLIFTVCFSHSVMAAGTNETIPMYGGMDRTADPELVEQDYIFIAGATRTFGTREHASTGYVDSGFDFFLQKKYDRAMGRFNEAWLLNPENPYVYLGFGSVLNSKQAYCEASKMFDLAGSKGLDESRFLADHAYAISQCIASGQTNEVDSLVSKANSLYEQAIQTPNANHRAYVYQMRARSALLDNDAELAGNMVKEAQKLGADIDQSLLQELDSADKQL